MMTTRRSVLGAMVILGASAAASAYVTSDANGTHITTPGTPAFGVNVDGVGWLLVDNNPTVGVGSAGTASLLPTGRHLLTAAHVVADSSGNVNLIDGADGNGVIFHTVTQPAGQVVFFDSTDVQIHPSYTGDPVDGYDIAIIDLGQDLSSLLPTYDLFTDLGNEFGRDTVKVGYGLTGYGPTGSVLGTVGTKRAGLNIWETDGIEGLGFTGRESMLTYDFDSGLAANDAFGFFFGSSGISSQNPIFDDLGFGNDEVGAAQGDSGGPSFILDNGQWKIAGITSFGFSPVVSDGTDDFSPDVDGGTINSSWGELVVDARVADPTILNWINGVVPEPASLTLIGAGALILFRRRAAA